jgi:hypothetical protein
MDANATSLSQHNALILLMNLGQTLKTKEIPWAC